MVQLRGYGTPVIKKKAWIADPSIINSQDNTRSHNINRTCDWLWRSALELGDYEHPSLQLQPPPGELHLFGPLTNDLADKQFATDQDMKLSPPDYR